MSTASKHRPTPTQVLRDRIAELEAVVASTPTIAQVEQAQAEAARLDSTVQDLTRHLSTVTEHTFLINGGPARIVARRHDLTDHWGVIDGTLMAARYWSRYHGWQPTGGNAADMFPWTGREARRYAEILAGDPGMRGEEPVAVVDVAAVPVEAEVQAPVSEPLPRRHAKPTVAEAVEWGEDLTRESDAHDPETTVTVPAPIDVPGYQPEPPDAPDRGHLLSLMAQGISANSEQATVALPLARVQGPAETQQMPVLHVEPIPPVPLPPLPEHPPFTEPLPPITWRGGNVRPLSESYSVQFAKAGAK